jgi:tetratricopeptide (TPR) repeat protein
MLAELMFQKEHYETAIYHFQQLLEKNPRNFRALAQLVQLLRRSGRLEEARLRTRRPHCLLIVYQRFRTLSTHHPPWPGHSFVIKRVLNPRLLRITASYDVGQAHICIEAHFGPSFF